MLSFLTGLIGNGKTLRCIQLVEKKRLDEKREVYYEGIPELTLPWKLLDMVDSGYSAKQIQEGMPAKVPDWMSCPPGSIVVIDEVWRYFPIRKVGSLVPKYVQELANSRRMGLDLYFITQDAKKQVDSFVRALSNEHIFLERKFGMEYSMEYVGQKVFDPSSSKELAACQNSRWMFPKEFYGTYKSAEEHTHKRKLPWKKFAVLACALVCVVGGISLAIHRLSPKKVIATDSSGRPSGAAQSNAGDFWVRDRLVRVASVPASAPVYDSLQKVKSQPRPEGCMQLVVGKSLRCECTGPNHSVLEIGVAACSKLVKGGWFDETQKYADPKVANIAALNGTSAESDKKDAQVE